MKFYAGVCLWLGILFLIKVVGLYYGYMCGITNNLNIISVIVGVVSGAFCWGLAFAYIFKKDK